MKKNWVSLLIYTLLTLTLINAACDDLDLIPKKRKKNDLPIVDGPALKLAVFPGGGVNAYTSLYLAKLFADDTGKGVYTSFDQAWGLSGGSIVASMLMVSHKDDEAGALTAFKTTVNNSFDLVAPIIKKLKNTEQVDKDVKEDNALIPPKNKTRRGLFEEQLNSFNLHTEQFGNADTKKLVIIAAEFSSKKPVYYAHQSLVIPKDSLRATNTTTVTTAIINSSNFQPGAILNEKGGLFQIVPDALMPDNKQYHVIDGAHVSQILDDGIVAVSANHPLGLAIDYLKKIRPNNAKEHQIVVFDNGSGPGAYAKKLNFNNGKARIEKDGVIINVYFIAIPDPNFNDRTYDIAATSFGDRETLVNDAVADPSTTAFYSAVNAIK